MDEKEITKTIKKLKQHYKTKYPEMSKEEIDREVLDVFFQAFCQGKLDRNDLTTLTNAMGYMVKDEILDQIEKEMKEGDK